ncbi:hypothetical protein SAMN05421848_0293 [Kushneria avicenniae]|uniref:Uncharacterized protein n=1 Tax=Kushneria avicenniae TaxID=402385 RepID=A0A1I1FWF6_9GAMM|nr:hypothetical protein SAMN05421848_0293 [Kushneria avicenniae]
MNLFFYTVISRGDISSIASFVPVKVDDLR